MTMPSHDQGPVITLKGEYDLTNRSALQQTLSEAENYDCVTFDLSNVQYMDSTAIACFVDLKKNMTRGGRSVQIILTNAKPHIKRLFEICGLDRILTIG